MKSIAKAVLGAFLLMQPQDHDLRDLIERLGSDDIRIREKAHAMLRELGVKAKPALEGASKSSNPETAKRAGRLLQRLSLMESLSPGLQKGFPGLADRLAFGGDRDWTEVFVEAHGRHPPKSRLPTFKTRDLAPLAARAVRGAETPDDKQFVCWALSARRIRSADAEVARLFEDPNEDVRWAAFDAIPRNPSAEILATTRELIHHQHSGIRGFAVVLASSYRMDDAAPDVERCLDDDEEEVRCEAVKALAELRGKAAIKRLISLLKDASADVRTQTIDTLARTLYAREGAGAIADLLEDPSSEVRETAFQALGRLGVRASIPQIAPRLESPDADIRFWAIRALERLAARELTTEVIKRLADKEEDVRRAALWFLEAVAPQKAAAEALKLLNHSNADTRASAIAALGAVRARNAVPLIREGLKDKETDVRVKAVVALGSLRVSEAGPDLIKLALEGVDQERIQAILALARLGAKEAIPEILKVLNHPSDRVRTVAVGSLIILEAKEAVAEIARLLKDPDGSVRAQSVRALAALQGREALSKIVPCLMDPHADQVSIDAIWALADLEAWEMAPQVEPLLKDHEWRVRLTAVAFLAESGSTSGVPVLLEEDPWNFLTFLNALRRPDVWKRLKSLPAPPTQDGTVLQEIERAARAAGLEVEVEPAPLDDADRWLGVKHEARDPELPTSVAQRLTRIVPFFTYLPVFETDRVRVLPRESGVRFWRAWWEDYQKSRK